MRECTAILWILVLVAAPASAGTKQDIAHVKEVCQFVERNNEKMVDASDGKDIAEYEEYTTQWIVNVPEGQNAADEIAERLGFINAGQVL